MQKLNLAIIGGGAAGLMAAALASERGLQCTVFEPNNKLGRKLRITGKGRCNVTNACDAKTLMENMPVNSRFLYSALSRFDAFDAMAYFESLGVPLKTERGNRVFPQSDSAHDIPNALVQRARKNGVRFVQKKVVAIIAKDGKITAIKAGDTEYPCDNVLLCTGGVSYPLSGSSGDGYRFAKSFGHTIIQPQASLVPLESVDEHCAEMQGFSLKNVSLSVYDENDKRLYEELGEMIFTHYGVSGPLVLSASAHMRDFDKHSFRLAIDLKPGLDEKKLDARILRDFEKNNNREFKNSLGELAGRTMIPVLVRLSEIPPDIKVNSITKAQRQGLVQLFKAFPVTVSRTRPIDEAIITSGGVSVKEIDPKTMQSKLVSGLYFAGEILDVDAYTGGFNLQIAWSSAHAVATSL